MESIIVVLNKTNKQTRTLLNVRVLKAQLRISKKVGQFRVRSFRTDFPGPVGSAPGIFRYSTSFPHCLRTSRNSENVIIAIDSALTEWQWRAEAAYRYKI